MLLQVLHTGHIAKKTEIEKQAKLELSEDLIVARLNAIFLRNL